MFVKIAAFALVAVAVASAAAVAPTGSAPPGLCGKYEAPFLNNAGEWRCIPKPDSCVGSPDFVSIACFVSPCMNFKDKCAPASQCFTDPCNACKPLFFDASYNKVCTEVQA